MTIILGEQTIVCQSYERTSDTLRLIGVETEDGLTDMTLKGVNWNAVELPFIQEIPTVEDRLALVEELLMEIAL